MAAKKRVSRGGTRKGKTGRVLPKRKTSPKASSPKAPKGSLRAQSWIYAAINPLIDALESEVTRLSQGHLSWRARERRLEFIRPPRRYLLESGQIILEDFERFFPKDAQPLEAHGKLVTELERCAAAAHDALLSHPDFSRRARELMEEYRRGSDRDIWNGWSEQELSDYVEEMAERLVNRVRKVDETWRDRNFWPMAVSELQRFSDVEEFRRLDGAVAACRADAARTIEHLKNVRFRLCDEYGIPAAPFDAVSAFERL